MWVIFNRDSWIKWDVIDTKHDCLIKNLIEISCDSWTNILVVSLVGICDKMVINDDEVYSTIWPDIKLSNFRYHDAQGSK